MSDNTIKPSTALAGKIAGMNICRVPIYQSVIGRKGWEWDMLKAIAACRRLGVQTFEVDARYNASAVTPATDGDGVSQLKVSGGYFSSMFGAPVRIEGDEWKDNVAEESDDASQAKKQKKGADVITVFAVVVE